jgi:hypothetical protein
MCVSNQAKNRRACTAPFGFPHGSARQRLFPSDLCQETFFPSALKKATHVHSHVHKSFFFKSDSKGIPRPSESILYQSAQPERQSDPAIYRKRGKFSKILSRYEVPADSRPIRVFHCVTPDRRGIYLLKYRLAARRPREVPAGQSNHPTPPRGC